MKRILLTITLLLGIIFLQAQGGGNCVSTATLSQDTIDCGDTVTVTINSFATSLVNEVFDISGPLDPGWQTTSGAIYTNPYIPSPPFPGSGDPDGGTYFWMGANTIPPGGVTGITTIPFNVSFGGQICFDFVYAEGGVGVPAQTEQPDQYDEGISVQYSLDGGLTWIDIVYYAPNGDVLPSNPQVPTPNVNGSPNNFWDWTSICITLPPGALTANTSFQWVQDNNSGACCDHWGLDNIQILAADPAYALFDGAGTFIPNNVFDVVPTQTTTFSYIYTNGVDDTCSSSVTVYLNETDAGPDIQVACDGLGTQLMSSGVSPNTIVSWSPAAGLSSATDPNPFATPLADTDYILTSQCGVDTISVFVEESFTINFNDPDTICANGATFITLTTSPASVPINNVQWNNVGTLNSPTGNQVLANPFSTTEYVATVTSDSGCVIQDSVIVQVQGVANTVTVLPQEAIVCPGESLDLTATVETPSVPYTLIQGTFNPYPLTGTVIGGLVDDNTQGPLPIPFNFPFFGTNYTQLWISSNGFITFSLPTGAFPFNGAIPNAANPNNIIAWGWDDMNFTTSGTFSFFTGGTSPNSYLVLNFVDVAYDFGPAGTEITVQVVLYESGLIEINNINVVPENGFTTMTQGIENANGTQALTPPGYNNASITSIGENWSYIPFNAPVNPVYTWTPGATLNTTQGPLVTASPSETTEYFVTMEDGFCSTTSSYILTVPEIYLETSDFQLCTAGDSVILTTVVDSLPASECLAGYVVSSIPYAPQPVVNGSGTSFGLTGDDQVLGPFNMGFDFNYFCEDFNQFWISSNGWLSFTNPNFNSDLSDDPIPTATGINHMIAFAWDDLRFNTGSPTAEYFVQGVSPNQRFIFQFLNVEHFGGSAATTVSVQVVLHEDGTIEMHNINVQPDNAFGTMTQGIENVNGTSGFSIPGHNSANFTSTAQSWRFAPNLTVGSFAINWTPNAQISSTSALSPEVWPTATTDYVIEVITDADGCSYFDTATVTIGFDYTIDADISVCAGDSAQLNVQANADTYAWTPNNGTITSTTIPNPIVFPTTSTTYFVRLDSANCFVEDSILVTVNAQPSVNINNGNAVAAICDGDAASLVSDADPTWDINWTGPQNGTGVSLSPTQAGVYTIRIEDENGCDAFASILVDVNENPMLDPNLVRNILCCNGDEVIVVFQDLVTNSVTLNEGFWDNSQTSAGTGVTVNSNEDGTYDLLVVSVDGCEASTQLTFETNCMNPDIADLDSTAFGGTIDYTVSTNDLPDSEVWTPNFTDNTFLANTAANQFETIFVETQANFVLNDGTEFNCIESDSSQVFIFLIADPVMPDAFSPNGDNLNERLFPVNLDPSTPVAAYRVYNRWGEVVYEYDGNDAGWDGTWKGEAQPADVYNYYFVIDKLDKDFVSSGTVTLIR